MNGPEKLTRFTGCLAEATAVVALVLGASAAQTEMHRALTPASVEVSTHEQRVADGLFGSAELLLMAAGGLTYAFAKRGGGELGFVRNTLKE